MRHLEKCVLAMRSGGAANVAMLWALVAVAVGVSASPDANAADRGRNTVTSAAVVLDREHAALAANRTRLVRVGWTSYLRAGPGLEFAVLDEIERLTWLRVESCGNNWCRLRTDSSRPGYLARGNLAFLATSPAAATQSPIPTMDPSGPVDESGCAPDTERRCVRSGLTGYRGRSDVVRICPG